MSSTNGGRLTTHVLDTALGKPAAGMRIVLFRITGNLPEPVRTVTTNDDGRCDGPLLEGEAFVEGTYELVFEAGEYLRASGADITEPAFLDRIPIRFGIANADQHYHVPLLISPYSYSTYRGS